ncbi:hypothetical protein N7470_005837 [Penicillium chermesinum]|nr:hypothetical protein N7470_005837 [Penicillium chermesinum]
MSDDDDCVRKPAGHKSLQIPLELPSCWILAVAIVIKPLSAASTDIVSSAPAGTVTTWMAPNDTFGLPPSPESDAAWNSLFPVSQGFIYSKQFREPRALVVYHNLHCLDALREVYYAAVNGTLAQRDGGHHHHEKDAEHVRHCLDYLRQSVMCAADTNLEPVVNELASGGDLFTTGWGFYRNCRDIERVKAWASANALEKSL